MKHLATCAFLAVAGLARDARTGESFERFAVTLEQCTHVDADLVRKIAAVELGSPVHTAAPEDDGRGWTQVGITCDGAEARLRLQLSASDSPLERALELAQHAGIERLLALAVAELIGASQAEAHAVVPRSQTTTEPSLPEAAVETEAPAPETPRSIRTWYGAAVSLVNSPARPLAGLAAGVDRMAWDWLVLRIELLSTAGVAHDALGELRTLQLAAGAGALVERRWRSLAIRGGGVVLTGATWLGLAASDSSVRGRTLVAPHLGPAAALESSYELDGWSLLLATKLGWVGAPLRGTYREREVVSVRGAWANLTIALQHAW